MKTDRVQRSENGHVETTRMQGTQLHAERAGRHSAYLGVVVLPIVLLALIHTSMPAWTAGFHGAHCIGPCCVITNGFFEFSCGEYTPPVTTATRH